MGCSLSSSALGSAIGKRGLAGANAGGDPSGGLFTMEMDECRGLIENSAFFFGITKEDANRLLRIVKSGNVRSGRRVPFPRSDVQLLLGGVRLNWEYVSNQPQATYTFRSDVVGAEALLLLEGSLGGAESQTSSNSQPSQQQQQTPSRTTNVSQLESMFDLTGDTQARNDLEYLYATRIPTGPNSCSSWFELDLADITKVARHSKTFNQLLHTKLKSRALARFERVGFLHHLTDSEFHFLAHAFDYKKLSALAAINNNPLTKREEDLQFFIVLDGTMQVDCGKHGVYLLQHHDVYGETSIILDVSTSPQQQLPILKVVQEGVALTLKSSVWTMFLNTVASEQTQRALLQEAQARHSSVKQQFPLLRRCRPEALESLMNACYMVMLNRLDRYDLDSDSFYLVKSGSVRCIYPNRGGQDLEYVDSDEEDEEDDEPDFKRSPRQVFKDLLCHEGQAFGFESVHAMLKVARNKRYAQGGFFPVGSSTTLISSVDDGHDGMDESSEMRTQIDFKESLLEKPGREHDTVLNKRVFFPASMSTSPCIVWRIPTKLLVHIMLDDPVFAADVEYIFLKSRASFHALLDHPVAVCHLRSYLVSVHAQENLDFYWTIKFFPRTANEVSAWYERHCNKDSSIDPAADQTDNESEFDLWDAPQEEENRERVVEILKEFVVTGAPAQINIDSQTHKRLESALNDPTCTSKQIFDSAFEEVLSILSTDSCPRFYNAVHPDGKRLYQVMLSQVLQGSISEETDRLKTKSSSSSSSPLKLAARASASPMMTRKSLFGGSTAGNLNPFFVCM